METSKRCIEVPLPAARPKNTECQFSYDLFDATKCCDEVVEKP